MILSILVFVLSVWLLFKIIKIAIKVAWCFAKIIVWILCIISLPLLIYLALTAAGYMLLLPVLLLVGAWLVIRAC